MKKKKKRKKGRMCHKSDLKKKFQGRGWELFQLISRQDKD